MRYKRETFDSFLPPDFQDYWKWCLPRPQLPACSLSLEVITPRFQIPRTFPKIFTEFLTLVQYDRPTVDQNCLVPIVVKALNQQAADSYYTYSQFLKPSYANIYSLCNDIDRAEQEIGKIHGHFYPVARGIINHQSVRMVYTSYP